MTCIGITGGIGSGKSYVAQLLRDEFNIPIYDCDTEAKRLNNEDPAIRKALIALVGPQVYDNSDTLVKAVLADYLFQNEENATRINAIIHPAVRRDFRQWQTKQTAEIVGLESAILFESGFNQLVDKVLYVDAPLPLRIQRAMQRDGAEETQIEQRISRQHTEEYKTQADYIIQNEKTGKTALMRQLRKIVLTLNRKPDKLC